jgi:uncharacterized protein YxjI
VPTAAPPAGWYADPWGQASHRWWDGAAWTAQLGAIQLPPAEPAPAPDARPTFAEAVAQHRHAELEREASLPRADHDSFEISQRFRLVINEYDVTASDTGQTVALVRQKRLALRERIDLWADASQTELLCAVQARKALEVRGVYDVLDPRGRRIGILQKRAMRSMLRSTWEVLDDAGTLQATVTETSLAIAIVRRLQELGDIVPVVGWALGMVPIPFGFTFTGADGRVLGEHRRVWGVRDRYRLTMHGDPDRSLDRRLAVALAICLDALQSR